MLGFIAVMLSALAVVGLVYYWGSTVVDYYKD